MTPKDAPYTLLEAVVRDLRSAMFDGAMTVALASTAASTPARRTAVEVANRTLDEDVTKQAEALIAYLGEHFAPGLAGWIPRLNDERTTT